MSDFSTSVLGRTAGQRLKKAGAFLLRREQNRYAFLPSI